MTTLIPKPPGVPLLGNIFDINPNNTWSSLQTLAEKYGEIFQIKVLGKTIVFVASAALAEELCDEKRFRKYVGGPIVEIRYMVHDALFTAFHHEESWGIAHRIIAPHLSPKAMEGLFDEMADITDELLARWKDLGPNNTIQPIDDLNRLNLEVTTQTLFGKRLHGLTGAPHPVIQAMEDATSEAIKRPTRPSLLNWLVYGGKLKKSTAVQRNYAADLVRARKEKPTDRQDLLSSLLHGKDPETGAVLTESQVIDEIVTMPVGSSTAPALLATAVHFLLQNPEVVTRAREEIDAVVGDGRITYARLSQLPYTEGVLRESLRLSFAAPGFNIEPIPRTDKHDKSPVFLGGGRYAVAHDQPMIIVLAGVNRDPTVFEEPLAFRPERMVGERFDALPLGVKRFFGNGKRECIGKHWAWQFGMLVLANMLKEIDFEAINPSYHLKQDGWFNLRPVEFFVKVKPRAA
ncbi:cytochrome P450 [Thozetella sp. PMI_491]|nr:cytochrome P450 [Thozetella sp. PMI_491]